MFAAYLFLNTFPKNTARKKWNAPGRCFAVSVVEIWPAPAAWLLYRLRVKLRLVAKHFKVCKNFKILTVVREMRLCRPPRLSLTAKNLRKSASIKKWRRNIFTATSRYGAFWLYDVPRTNRAGVSCSSFIKLLCLSVHFSVRFIFAISSWAWYCRALLCLWLFVLAFISSAHFERIK